LVAQLAHQPPCPFFTHLLQANEGTRYLYDIRAGVDGINRAHPGFVYMAVRIVKQQVAKTMDRKFLAQKISPLGAHTLEVLNRAV
jgi:hypothetical protein